jgi:hypothetical protein
MKKYIYLALILALAPLPAMASNQTADFGRYQVILDRKAFGTAPPPPDTSTMLQPGPSFASQLRMSALLEDEDSIRIGLIDLSNNQNFFLGVGEVQNGVELVSADYVNEEAVLRKGSEMAVIKLQSGVIEALTPAQQQQRLSMSPSRPSAGTRPSYADRRLARQQQRQKQPPPQPKYTGEELEKHLQEYQMEVIRQGLPPLPIPLTPEMDDQLVREGVLPPVE